MRTDQIASKFSYGIPCKRKNDYIMNEYGHVMWFYHNNLIAEYKMQKPNELIVYLKWFTISTKRRLNMISDWRFYSERGKRMVYHREFGKQILSDNEFIIYE